MKRLLLALLFAPLVAFGQTNNYNILDHSSGTYNPASVAITGGTIDGTAIGGTAPSTGKFTSLTNTGLTANSFVYSGTGGLMSSTAAPTNGQLLIGSTGAAPVAATITGTANQINVTNGAGSVTLGLPSTLAIPGTITSLNGFATVGNGVPYICGKYDAATQQANVPTSTVMCSVPSNGAGLYYARVYVVITQAATTSSTLPQVQCIYTDRDSGTTQNAFLGATSTANTVGTFTQSGGATMNVAASTNITCGTSGYASAGTTPMQFSVHIKVMSLGN